MGHGHSTGRNLHALRNVVFRHTSPYEDHAFAHFFDNAGERIVRKITDNFFDVAPAVVIGVSVYKFAEWYRDNEEKHHRS